MRLEKPIIYTLLFFFIFSSVLMLLYQPGRKNFSGASPVITQRQAIALLYINGPISAGHASSISSTSLDAFVEQLYDIEKDLRIQGVVIRINSPGGTVGSSQELYNELLAFKKRSELPIVVSIADMCTSGAYWAALSANYIYSNPGSIVGNIGVIMSTVNFGDLANEYGIRNQVVKSGPYKDLMSNWRTPSEDESNILNTMVKEIHGQFVSALKDSRKDVITYSPSMTDGRIFTGQQAKANGLIDELGGLQDAINKASEMAGISGRPEIIQKMNYPLNNFFNLWKSELKGYLSKQAFSVW